MMSFVEPQDHRVDTTAGSYTVAAVCRNCGWCGDLVLSVGREAPQGGLGGGERTCQRCGCRGIVRERAA
jgi:hypothetical protein